MMESGPAVGISSSTLMLVVTGWLIQRFFDGPRSWRSLALHWALVALSSGFIWGLAYEVNVHMNLVDSSHGFWALGVPGIFGVIGSAVALVAFAFGALAAHSHAPASPGDTRHNAA
jgi:hypothetical protein